MSKIWRVPVYWQFAGVVEIEANSVKEAIRKVTNNEPLPRQNTWERVDESYGIQLNGDETSIRKFNGGQKDEELVGELAELDLCDKCYDVLFFEDKIKQSDFPNGYVYRLRVEDCGANYSITKKVIKKYGGSFVTKEPLDIGEEHVFVPRKEGLCSSETFISVNDFFKGNKV